MDKQLRRNIMDKKLKDKWVKALRSGNYKQGKNKLRSLEDNCFCCLGVLCDVIDPEGWEEDRRAFLDRYKFYYKSSMGSGLLPYEVLSDFFGPERSKTNIQGSKSIKITAPFDIKTNDCKVIKKGEEIFLDTLNDLGVEFNTIADIIEQTL